MKSMSRPDYLILINKNHPIDPRFVESIELVEAVGYDGEIFRAEKHAAEQFEHLQEAVKEYGIEAVPEIVVNGKYLAMTDNIDTAEQYIELIGYLLTLK